MYEFLTFAFFLSHILCRDGSDLRSSAPIATRLVSDDEGLVATGCIRDSEPMVASAVVDEMCCVDIDRLGIPFDCSWPSIGGGCIRKFRGKVLFKSRSSSR